MTTLSLPDLIGVSVADSLCVLSSEHIIQLGKAILHLHQHDSGSICFVGSLLGQLASSQPDFLGMSTQVVSLENTLGDDPFLVLAGHNGTLALLTVPASSGYRTRIFSNTERVDRAALVLEQYADEYTIETTTDATAQRSLIASLIATLLNDQMFYSQQLSDLFPDDQSTLRLGQALWTHTEKSTCLDIAAVQQLLRATGSSGAIMGKTRPGQGNVQIVAATEGLLNSQVQIQATMLRRISGQQNLLPVTRNDVVLGGAASDAWGGDSTKLALVPLTKETIMNGVLLVASKRPHTGNAKVMLHGLGVLLAYYLEATPRPEPVAATPASATPRQQSSRPQPSPRRSTPAARQARQGTSPDSTPSFQPLLEHIYDSILILDDRGRLLKYNASAAHLLGLQPQDREKVLTETKASVLSPVLTQALLGDLPEAEVMHLPSGQKVTVTVLSLEKEHWGFVLHRIVEASASTDGVVAGEPRTIVKDYNESLISSFSATIRAPLQALRELITRLPAAGSLNEQQSHLIGQVVKLNSELTLMVNDLLTLGQISLQTGDSSGPLRIDMLLEAGIGTRYAEFDRRGQQVETHMPPDGVRVIASEEGIGRVIGTLLDNANFYSPPGSRIDVRVNQKEHEVIIEIEDNGIGLAEDEINRVFEPFYRAPSTEELGVPGRGLGLTIAKAVVEHHGGNIWVTSTPGKGSIFGFCLPLEPAIDVAEYQ